MKLLLRPVLFLALGLLAHAQRPGTPAAPPHAAASEFELLHARPFVLETPYTHTWRKEAPPVTAGWLLVLRADVERIRPRQGLEPVLYVGAQTAERVNAPPAGTGQPGELGQLVVVVPAALDEQGQPALDPWSVPIFLGTPRMPEDVDEARIQLELVRAARLGLGPVRRPPNPNGPNGTGAPAPAPPLLRLTDRNALELELASLIEFWSPEEVDLVASLRVPVSR